MKNIPDQQKERYSADRKQNRASKRPPTEHKEKKKDKKNKGWDILTMAGVLQFIPENKPAREESSVSSDNGSNSNAESHKRKGNFKVQSLEKKRKIRGENKDDNPKLSIANQKPRYRFGGCYNSSHTKIHILSLTRITKT